MWLSDIFDRPSAYALKHHLPSGDFRDSGGATRFWKQLGTSYRYLSRSDPFVQCAEQRWSNASDCMPGLVWQRYQQHWWQIMQEEYEACCNPLTPDRCRESDSTLPLCGFPFGSVDHLPAFLPELTLQLPSGPMRLRQGITDEDLLCDSGRGCRLRPFFVHDLETTLLWSTALAVYLDLQSGLQGSAIDLGAGVGLTCMVLMRKGLDVSCTDVDNLALEAASRNTQVLVEDTGGRAWGYGSLTVLRFNYSTDHLTWRQQGIFPPYDVLVMASAPQGELKKRLGDFARLFRRLGKQGTRVFLEDQGHRKATRAAPEDREAVEAFAEEGLHLMDMFDPFDRGLWPLPRGRIYSLRLV